MSFILHTGIILSLFLGVILFLKKNKSLSDKILAVWLFSIAVHLLSYLIYSLGYWEIYPHLIGITVPFPLLHGPFLFLYVLYSLRDKKHLQKIDYLNFLPALLVYIYLLPFYFGYSEEEKRLVDKGLVDDHSTFSDILLVAFIVSGISYVVLTYRKLAQHEKVIESNFSSYSDLKLDWLKYSIYCFIGVFSSAAVIILLREFLQVQFPFNADIVFYSFIVLFVLYIGYSGIRQQNLFFDSDAGKGLVGLKPESGYKKSGLKDDIAQSKHNELLRLMEEEKPYLVPKLTLGELADKLEISSNHLSQIINQYEKVNFHDFVNTYRINEFIERVKTNKSFNYLAHALDSGFSSKSSFNSVFKKLKKSTPSQYFEEMNT